MKLKLLTFSLITFIFVSVSLDIFHINHYFDMRDNSAKVIMSELDISITDLGFILNKSIKDNNTPPSIILKKAEPLLDRKIVLNPFIKAITLFYENKPIVYTDHKNINQPNYSLLVGIYKPTLNYYNYLMNATSMESDILIYDGLNKRKLKIVYYLDNEKLYKELNRPFRDFVIEFMIYPFIFLILLSIIILKLIVLPIKTLIKYPYQQKEKLKPFKIFELEELRLTLIGAFSKLESEKKEIYELSRTDTLTGISNRNSLNEFVSKLIDESTVDEKEFALLFLDLDDFKTINDTLGHDIGDNLLKDLALKVSSVLKSNDHIARIGGDEFIIVLSDFVNRYELIECIEKIENKISTPNSINGYDIDITSSIGISLFPSDSKDIIGLMKKADIALYRSKDNGKNQHSFYTSEIDTQMQDFISMTSDMKDALKNNEYEVYYQPQNDVKTGKIIGCEALLRWIHPTKGFIAPSKFIPLAEQSGFIVELGTWILEDALRQKKEWETMDIDIEISINVAAKQIISEGFINTLVYLLNKYDINKTNIALEITEYIFLNNTEMILDVFNQIKRLGIKIHLNDFGTGYSSLSYLRKFPIDIIKIDKAFVDDYKDGEAFIATIINMAKTLKLGVIAEGVETIDQFQLLKKLECDRFQGYLSMKPITSKEFLEQLTLCNHSSCSNCELPHPEG